MINTNTTISATITNNSTAKRRLDLNGAWKLDKTRGSPSMKYYLETMGVTPLAIEANEKGDADQDTIHIITLTSTDYNIKKISRVNDLTLSMILGQEQKLLQEDLDNNDKQQQKKQQSRVKSCLATSSSLRDVLIVSNMPTINGDAYVTDRKTMEEHPGERSGSSDSTIVLYKQELTVRNEWTGKEHTTIRYFVPHVVLVEDEEEKQKEVEDADEEDD